MSVEDDVFEEDYMPEYTLDEQGLDDVDIYENLINSVYNDAFFNTE